MRVKDARQTFLGLWIRLALSGEELQVFGDGSQRRDLNFIDDVIDAFSRAALGERTDARAYNLGSNRVVTLLDSLTWSQSSPVPAPSPAFRFHPTARRSTSATTSPISRASARSSAGARASSSRRVCAARSSSSTSTVRLASMDDTVRVPFLDLRRQVMSMRAELDTSIGRVLDQGHFILEEQVAAFEAAFAAYCGAGYAVGVASGTDAITIALRALGIGAGDEVVVPANVCVPTVAGVEAAGARPVLADPETASFALDPDQLAEAITPRTRAVVVVHLYGQCGDMSSLLEVARRLNLRLVEDAAHAHGASYQGTPVGSLGDAAAFSFYPTKNLGALGDGGAVVTNDGRTAERARRLRSYGFDDRGRSILKGTNSRLDTLQAAVLLTKLRRLDTWNERRRELATRYREALHDTGLILPAEADGREHVYHHFVVRSRERERLREKLRRTGVGTAVHYPLPIHGHRAYAGLARGADLRVSEELAATVLSLPLYPELTDTEQEYVIDAVAKATRHAPSPRRPRRGQRAS